MSASAEAWLLEPGGDITFAIGTVELAHVVTAGETRLQRVPCAPEHCAHSLLWNGTPVPVLDLVKRLRPGHDDEQLDSQHLLALVQYAKPGTDGARSEDLQIGAVRLAAVPRRHVVTDEQACTLPDSLTMMRPFTLACFAGPEEEAVPVVDLSKLFAST